MAYIDVFAMTQDTALHGRMAAAAATEQVPGDPDTWVANHRYQLAAAPGWGDAWASAIASDNPDPGADPGVITDGMILSQVQALLAG
jgi:hypothetical protein